MTDLTTSCVPPRGLYTVSEAAYVVETDHRFINREIDADILPSAEHWPERNLRLLDRASLLYFAAVRDIRTTLDTRARKDIFRRVNDAVRRHEPAIRFGAFQAPIKELDMVIQPRLDPVNALRDQIEINPAVGGGEPVLKGTRLKVRMLAELARRGVPLDEIATEFDTREELVNLAVLYDLLHPRRGRPSLVRHDLREHVPFTG